MAFEVIPGIDVSEGKLCRMAIGGPTVVREFGGDPIVAAEAFVAAGARRLHVVDLDLAFTGEARNLVVLRSTTRLGVPVQASGGILSAAQVERALEAGADRAVLGSGVLGDRAAVEPLIDRFGERLVAGIETEEARVHARGRGSGVDLDIEATVAWLASAGASRFLHTNVLRVGELTGPDLADLALVVAAGRPTVAAGGISSIEDLRAVADAGAEAAVVGRALTDGRLDPAAAFGGGLFA